MHKDIKKVVKAALKRGWRRLPDGKHHIIQFGEVGRKLHVSMSPSDENAHHNLKRAILRVEREEKEKSDADLC